MRLIIQGNPTNLKKSEIRFASQWAAKELIGKRLSQNIRCYMDFKKTPKNQYGSCMPIGYLPSEPDKARSFRIEISNEVQRKAQLETIFHELAHLKQCAMQELVYCKVDDNTHLWRRKLQIDESQYHYCELPWEIEAFKLEGMLYRRYVAFIKENYISFT